MEAAEYQRTINRQENESVLESFPELNVKITYLNQDAIDAFKEKTAVVYKSFKDTIGADFMNEVLRELGRPEI